MSPAKRSAVVRQCIIISIDNFGAFSPIPSPWLKESAEFTDFQSIKLRRCVVLILIFSGHVEQPQTNVHVRLNYRYQRTRNNDWFPSSADRPFSRICDIVHHFAHIFKIRGKKGRCRHQVKARAHLTSKRLRLKSFFSEVRIQFVH